MSSIVTPAPRQLAGNGGKVEPMLYGLGERQGSSRAWTELETLEEDAARLPAFLLPLIIIFDLADNGTRQ